MRWIALIGLLTACGGPSEGDLERRARASLARDGWTELAIERVEGAGEGTFDFTGVREGRRCEGTIQVRVAGDRTTSSMQSRCD